MVVAADPTVLRGIPEFFENEIGEALAARTESLATFRELGPPDLCHIVKSNPKATGPKELGSYHFVLGADASSSATLAAYLNSLTYMLNQTPGKTNPWKVKSGTYCCFDAFSRVDVRVEVKIPGGVDSYLVDLRGDRHPIASMNIWQETFVSAVLRAIVDDNDEADGNDGHPLLGLRKIDPLTTVGAERRFLEAASLEFWKGWQLGSDPEIQVATYYSNHLTNGILKYFQDGGRLGEAAKFFADLGPSDQDVAAVLAKALLGTDEEIKAVKVMFEASKKLPVSYNLLLVQADFLMSKKQYERALKLVKLAVTYAPSEFIVWSKLTELYIEVGDYESALLALNSCPMFTYCERDAQRMPPPARTHLPLRPDSAALRPDQDPKSVPQANGSIFDENDPRENEVHPELQRLPSLTLRGTFLKAYNLLIRIVSKVGWDDLLKFRSLVFVMEDEYRIHRSIVEESKKGDDDDDDDAADGNDDDDDEQDGRSASGSAVRAAAAASGGRRTASPVADQRRAESAIPLESISLDDDGDMSSGRVTSAKPVTQPVSAGTSTSPSKTKSAIDELVKRASVEQGSPEKLSPKKGRAPNPRTETHRISLTFKHKRLCEKWLDNLFMVLYNDLRLYTALKQEMAQFKSQTATSSSSSTSAAANTSSALMYRKTGSEWEIYGDLAERLLHRDDAKEAYRLCLDQKLSTKAWTKLMHINAQEGHIQPCLQAIVKMVSLMDRTFDEHTFPSSIARCLFTLIKRHGLAKVQNALISMNVPTPSYRHITRYFEYAELFRVAGAEW
ncbi:Chs5p-Arf1p-binding proteins-domain-containing protein [Entophlyctis helioformis]|nr:Chs5p-Arf1p-binding proteins-domain-containing protein [Entophlyctis helioformis]